MDLKKRIKVEKNFYLDEFIPKELYIAHQEYQLRRLIDERLFKLMQVIRDRHGARTINDWWNGKGRNYSGYRQVGTSYYSLFSCHSNGRATDSIGKTTAPEIWEDIRKNYNTIYKPLGLTIIEVGKEIDWLHVGLGATNLNGLFEIKM